MIKQIRAGLIGLALGVVLVAAYKLYADQLVANVSTTSYVTDDGSCTSITASATVLPANPNRRYAVVLAKSTNTDLVFIKLGTTATNADFPLAAGSGINITGQTIYLGKVDAIANAGTQVVCIIDY